MLLKVTHAFSSYGLLCRICFFGICSLIGLVVLLPINFGDQDEKSSIYHSMDPFTISNISAGSNRLGFPSCLWLLRFERVEYFATLHIVCLKLEVCLSNYQSVYKLLFLQGVKERKKPLIRFLRFRYEAFKYAYKILDVHVYIFTGYMCLNMIAVLAFCVKLIFQLTAL